MTDIDGFWADIDVRLDQLLKKGAVKLPSIKKLNLKVKFFYRW